MSGRDNRLQRADREKKEDIGDEFGAPVIADRAIRIIDNPQHSYQGLYASEDHPLPPRLVSGLRDFTQMEDDVDRQRLLGNRAAGDPSTAIISEQLCKKERYERLLRRARTEDLSEISGIGCLYQTGKDRFGRPVICFIGKWFRATDIDLDKALLYLIYLLEPLVTNDYTIVYFHTLTESDNHPAMAWIREVYDVLEYKYKKNLKAFYIVHPTIWTKLMSWWFTTFMAPGIKQKVHNITGVEYLYSMMDMDQLEIPAFITEHDMTINGIRYFRPQA